MTSLSRSTVSAQLKAGWSHVTTLQGNPALPTIEKP
jgi:hypothetical protein